MVEDDGSRLAARGFGAPQEIFQEDFGGFRVNLNFNFFRNSKYCHQNNPANHQPEFGASRRQRGYDAADVIADEAESRCFRLFLYSTPECSLGRMRHRVGLVEYDDFERWTRLAVRADGAGRQLSETFDFVSYHLYAPVVRCVQFEDPFAKHVAKKLPSCCDYGACFSCACQMMKSNFSLISQLLNAEISARYWNFKQSTVNVSLAARKIRGAKKLFNDFL